MTFRKSCSAPKLKDLFDEELPCDQPRKPSCGKQKDEMWRIQLLEELRRLEEQSQMSESEHSSTREFLLQQLAHYEQELLKVQKSETIVKEERVPIPVRVPVPIAVRVPVIQVRKLFFFLRCVPFSLRRVILCVVSVRLE